MTDAPERIWTIAPHVYTSRKDIAEQAVYIDVAQEYTRSDLCDPDAMIAGAYEAAAKAAYLQADISALPQDLRNRVRTLTPADAKAALDRIVREAVEAEREACAVIADYGMLVPPDGGSPTQDEIDVAVRIAAAIRERGKGDECARTKTG